MMRGVNSEHCARLDCNNLEAHPYNEEPDYVVHGSGNVFSGHVSLFRFLRIFIRNETIPIQID